MTQLSFNTTNLTNANDLVPTLINTTDNVSIGYFGLFAMIGIFIVMFFLTFKQDGDVRLDLARSMMISSGFTSIFGLVLLVTGLTSSFVHLMWFMTMFLVSIIIIFNLKRKGQ